MAVPYIGFDSQNNWVAAMEYERNHRSLLRNCWKGTVRISAKVFTHYNSKMVQPAGIVDPWKVLLLKLDGPRLVQVWESAEFTMPGAFLDVPTLTLQDGIYYLSSTAKSTLTEMVMIRNNKALIPEPETIAIFPGYMLGEWGVGSSFDANAAGQTSQPAIIRWQGLRPARTTSVPLGASKPLTARLPREKLWHQAVTLATNQKQFVRAPVTVPWGGVMEHHPMRYQAENWDDLHPLHTADSNQIELSPSEDMDGYPADSGIGVVCSGFQHPGTYNWICLSPMGRIVEIDRMRKMTTRYGMRRKPGTLHPRRWDLAPTVGERDVFMMQHYDRIGAGPDIWRSWSMCPDSNDPDRVYVANTGSNTITRVDLKTGIGTTIAGFENVRGSDENHFDQPRGVVHLTKGKHAGKLLICDEHNSRVGALNLSTGEFKTLFQAKRVPQNPLVELDNNLPMDSKNAAGAVTKVGIRALWGMPGPKGSVQKLADCQFVHPCQAAEMSDGRIVISHHDEYRISIVDLEAGTMTYFADYPLMGSRSDALPRAWPTVFVDKLGAFGGKDDIFGCTWFQSAEIWLDQAGVRHTLTAGGYLTCEGSGELCRQFAYARVTIPGVNGELLYSGDDANGVHILRAELPSDPILDKARYDRGAGVYATEGTRPDGSKRAALQLSHGPKLQNYWGGLKCGADFAAMDQNTFNGYWRNVMGASDITDAQMLDFRYWACWQSAEGVQKMREGIVV